MQKKSINRRDFIKSSVATSAALGFPAIVPSTVFGADAPSNRVNVGMIGCGGISGYFISPYNLITLCIMIASHNQQHAYYP